MAQEIDVSAWKDWLGRNQQVEDFATARMAANFHATLDPYLAPVPAGEAPVGLQWCLGTAAPHLSRLGPDGGAAGSGFLPDIPLPRRMGAGGDVATFKPIPLGARVVRRSTIADISLKSGKSGQLVFVAIDHEFVLDDGSVAARDRQMTVFREAAEAAPKAASPAAPVPPPAPEHADETWTIEPTPMLLFRYSALSFNAHRIHYDRPYTLDVEKYPGLLVHGPLQGVLAFNLAAVVGGRTPTAFSYRNLGSIYDGAPFHVKARREADGKVTVWTESDKGAKGLSATASWDV